MTEEQQDKLLRDTLQQKITIGKLLVENAELRLALMDKAKDAPRPERREKPKADATPKP